MNGNPIAICITINLNNSPCSIQYCAILLQGTHQIFKRLILELVPNIFGIIHPTLPAYSNAIFRLRLAVTPCLTTRRCSLLAGLSIAPIIRSHNIKRNAILLVNQTGAYSRVNPFQNLIKRIRGGDNRRQSRIVAVVDKLIELFLYPGCH